MISRLISDIRDLWTLITKGQPKDDPFLPWRMMAEMAKLPETVDYHKWEAEMYIRNLKAFWFDPDRYAGDECDWPVTEKVKALTAYRDALIVKYGNLKSDNRFITV